MTNRACVCSAEAELNLVAGRSRSVGKVEYLHLNLASFRSISNFVTEFNKKNLPLHILANNAAVWMTEDQMTEDGFEVYATNADNRTYTTCLYQAQCCLQNQIGTHFFGHAYLTSLLLPKLKKSSPSRIVWTTSAAETSGDVDWDNLEYVVTCNTTSTCDSVHNFACQLGQVPALHQSHALALTGRCNACVLCVEECVAVVFV